MNTACVFDRAKACCAGRVALPPIVGLALMSLACATAVTAKPSLFVPLLLLDLWLLGYHHVIATSTRLALDC